MLVVAAFITGISLSVLFFSGVRTELLVAGSLLILTVILWYGIKWMLSPQTFAEKKDFLDLFVKICGGAAVILSLVFTWQGIKNTQEAAQRSQDASAQNLQIAAETLEANRKHQLAERYGKAIEQISSENLNSRVGAIYGLGEIAKNLPDEYHWPVMQVLTSFIRFNAPWKKGEKVNEENGLRRDIQSVFNVIATRVKTYLNGEGDQDERLSFFKTNLSGLSVIGKNNHLEGVSFRYANLTNANFRDSHLEHALMTNAILIKVNFHGTSLDGVDFSDADITDADFTGTSGLTPEQLILALNWEKAKLPDDLRDAITEIIKEADSNEDN